MKQTHILLTIIVLIVLSKSQTNTSGFQNPQAPITITEDMKTKYLQTTSSTQADTSTTLPLIDNPHLIQELNTKTELQDYNSVMSYLSPDNQKLISTCTQDNTDKARLFDAQCYLDSFETKVKKPMIQAYNTVLTARSKQMRNSLACLTKATQVWGTSADSTTNVIDSDLATIIAQQTTFNTCIAKFSSFMIQMSLARHRYLIAPSGLRDQTLAKDSNNITGFFYTTQEQSDVVTNFKTYAKCLYEFNNNINTKIMDIQAMVAKMPGCSNMTQSSATQAQGTQSIQAQSTIQSGQTQTTAQNTNTTSAHRNLQTTSNISATSNLNQFKLPSYYRNPADMGRTNSNVQSVDAYGRITDKTVSDDLNTRITTLLPLFKAKNAVQWTTLENNIEKAIDPKNGYKPKSALHLYVLDKLFTSSQTLKVEWNKAIKGDNCDNDYVYYCTGNKCTCLDFTCPVPFAGMQDYPVTSQPAPQIANNNMYGGQQIPESVFNVSKDMVPNMPKKTLDNIMTTNPTAFGNISKTPAFGGNQQQGVNWNANGQVQPLPQTQQSGQIMPNQQTPQGSAQQPPQGSAQQPLQGSAQQAPSNLTQPSGSAQQMPPNSTKQSGSAQQVLSQQAPPPAIHNLRNLQEQTNTTNDSILTTTVNGPVLPILNFGTQTDSMSDYYTASICLNRKRYIYTEVTTQLGGKQFDFASAGIIGAGDQQSSQANACAYILSQGTSQDKQQCRGQMNTQCEQAFDQFCQITNFYPMLQQYPSLTSPYPIECDNLQPDYSEQNCFKWITDRLMKGTIVFDTNGLFNLPMEIQNNIQYYANIKKMRYLDTSSSFMVMSKDPVLNDSQSASVVTKSSLGTSDVNVDSATSITAPNAAVYITDLNRNTNRVTTGSEFLRNTYYLVLFILVSIF
jgi:hypothetical protein